MKIDAVKKGFDAIAEDYDANRRKFISCYDDFYGLPVELLAARPEPPVSVLDLGAGTGLLTRRLYERFPDAAYVLADISGEMLEINKSRSKLRDLLVL